MATVGQALARAAGLGLARLDAHLLMLHAMGRQATDRAWLIAHDDMAIDPATQQRAESLFARRAEGEPVAYLLGRREFHGLELAVGPGVLVPRPETELLVEWAIELLSPLAQGYMVDLGTGSGAIALAVKHRLPAVQVDAVDASPQALVQARANADRLHLHVDFRLGSWLQGCSARYDLIASNPPYVASGDPHLRALRHEPLSALASGPDGLDDLRSIIAQAPANLVAGGWLLLEHGYDHAAAVRGLLEAGGFGRVSTRCDLAGIERCTGGCRLELG